MKIIDWQAEVHTVARTKGFYDKPKTDLESIMLMVSELAEAAEEIRKTTVLIYYNLGKPEGLAIELADCVIRILDYCESKHIDLEYCMKIKNKYNKTRPYMHGKKI